MLGDDNSGKLGNGNTVDHSTIPLDVFDLTSGVKSVSTGARHACALTITGWVKCWGANDKGQLGNGNLTNSAKPVNVTDLTSGVIGIATGDNHSCARLSGGKLKCWGDNSQGQLGTGPGIYLIPTDVVGTPFTDKIFKGDFE